jgi:hypothetical protein
MTLQAKKNYCTAKGACVVPKGVQESSCTHCRPCMTNGLCVYRVWFEDRCLSPFALSAARGATGEREATA